MPATCRQLVCLRSQKPIGLETCHPSALTVDDLITILGKDICPEKLEPKAIDQVVQR